MAKSLVCTPGFSEFSFVGIVGCGGKEWVRTIQRMDPNYGTVSPRDIEHDYDSWLAKTLKLIILFVERGSSVVECRNRNQDSPGSNPRLVPFRRLGIFVFSIDASVDSAV